MSFTLCLSHCVSRTMSHSHYDSHIMLICPSRYVSQYCVSHTMSHSHTTSLAHFVSFCTLRSIYQASYASTVSLYVSYPSARSLPHAYCVCPSNVVSYLSQSPSSLSVCHIITHLLAYIKHIHNGLPYTQVLSSTHTLHIKLTTTTTTTKVVSARMVGTATAHCSLCTHQFYSPLDPTSYYVSTMQRA